jgi:hypothetical protein
LRPLDCSRSVAQLYKAAAASPPRRRPADRLAQLYKRAMQLEVEFFSGQPCLPAPRELHAAAPPRRRAALHPACTLPAPRAASPFALL